MTPSAIARNSQSDRPIWWFLLCWTLFNIAQAYRLEIHADEAYYWMYSKFLDWGYFDHPPMVAVFIWLGDHVMHNELGLRLVTILTSATSLYLLWRILKSYAVDAKVFILVVSGIFIFHIYGFITTPDAPLFFFTVLFYFVYQRYAKKDSWSLGVLIGIVTACMLYSKYHAVLLVALTLFSNPRLLRRESFWLAAIIAACLYVPHILWQVNHHYPSIEYHLYDRSASKYDPGNSLSYIPGQLLMAGPLIGWLLFYRAYKVKVTDDFTRCLMVNGIGTFIFFFLSTFRGEAQPHWTLIAFAPLAMLSLVGLSNSGLPKWFNTLAIINICFIVFLRISIMFQLPPIAWIGQIKSFYAFKRWAMEVQSKAGDSYVIMSDGFQDPSKYNYYTNSIKGFSYDSRYYRLTQYDIWPIEDSLQHKRTYFLQDGPSANTVDTIRTHNWKWYGEWVDDTRTYQQITIDPGNYKVKLAPGQRQVFVLKVVNPYPYNVDFSDSGQKHKAALDACFFQGEDMKSVVESDSTFNRVKIGPKSLTLYPFKITAPKQKGEYDLMFSVITAPFSGGKNSRIIHVTVE